MSIPSSNPGLADEIIARLNMLIEDPAVRADVWALLNMAVPASPATVAHPTIQCGSRMPDSGPSLRVLGLLCGLCGAIEGGRRKGQGFIAMQVEMSEPQGLACFCRNDEDIPVQFNCSDPCREGRCGKANCNHATFDELTFVDADEALKYIHEGCTCTLVRADGRTVVK